MKKVLSSIIVLSLLFGFIPPIAGDALPDVRISEICTDPQHDWSTNGFDGTTGSGSVTGSDEYIEIVNTGTVPIDLTGWRIEYTDSSTDSDGIDASLVKNTSNVSSMPAGAYWILGNPVGSMNNDVQVRLLDEDGVLVDQVTIGNFDDGDVNDNAPSGNASSATDEVIARDPESADTDTDADDWQQQAQSMGVQNHVFVEVEETDNGSDTGDSYQHSNALRLSEVFPNPADDENDEFIELFNESKEAVDLAGWYMSDASREFRFPGTPGQFVVPAQGYLAVDRSTTSLALNNSGGETVTLSDPSGISLDSVTYLDSARDDWSYALVSGTWVWTDVVTPGTANVLVNEPPTLEATFPTVGRVGQELVFSVVVEDADDDLVTVQWDFGDEVTAPGEQVTHAFSDFGDYSVSVTADDQRGGVTSEQISVAIRPYDVSDRVLLNELFPNPEGSDATDEWIEIVNEDNRVVDLSGWSLTDERTSFTIPEGTTIDPGEYRVFERPETGITLNNSTDSVFLVAPDGTIVHGVAYSSAPVGKSWARRAGDEWLWSSIPTPGNMNAYDGDAVEESTSVLSVAEARDAAQNDELTVRGVITAAVGTLGSRVGYLMDDTGGLQFYLSKGVGTDLAVGDDVTLTGKFSVLKNGVRIRVQEDANVVHHGTRAISALQIGDQSLDKFPDQLVQVSGELIERHGRNLFVATGPQTTIEVSMKQSVSVDLKGFVEGRRITATGIAVSSGDDTKLFPRSADDVVQEGDASEEHDDAAPEKVDANPNGSVTTTDRLWYAILGGISTLGSAGYGIRYWWMKKRGIVS